MPRSSRGPRARSRRSAAGRGHEHGGLLGHVGGEHAVELRLVDGEVGSRAARRGGNGTSTSAGPSSPPGGTSRPAPPVLSPTSSWKLATKTRARTSAPPLPASPMTLRRRSVRRARRGRRAREHAAQVFGVVPKPRSGLATATVRKPSRCSDSMTPFQLADSANAPPWTRTTVGLTVLVDIGVPFESSRERMSRVPVSSSTHERGNCFCTQYIAYMRKVQKLGTNGRESFEVGDPRNTR